MTAVCHRQIDDIGFSFQPSIPFYTLNEANENFIPASAPLTKENIPLLYFTYDHCVDLMLSFLRQTLQYMSTDKDTHPMSFIQATLFAPPASVFEYEDVFQWLQLVEQCCMKILANSDTTNSQTYSSSAHGDYITTCRLFAKSLWEGGAFLQTILKSNHSLAESNSIPLLALVFEGYTIATVPERFKNLRRPLIQQCILVNFNRCLETMNNVKNDHTLEEKVRRAEDTANLLLQEEEIEKARSIKKREKKRKQRERKQKKNELHLTSGSDPLWENISAQECVINETKDDQERGDKTSFTFSALATEFIPLCN